MSGLGITGLADAMVGARRAASTRRAPRTTLHPTPTVTRRVLKNDEGYGQS
jgi:hypothetical protein